MTESMFGRPSQHLLPFQPQPADAAGTTTANTGLQTTAVDPAAPRFEDFRFNSIGKQPGLLSRISQPNSENAHYHSPTLSRTSVSPPPFNPNDIQPQPKMSSRPTLFQQLTGGRTQINASTSNNSGNVTLATTAQIPPPRPRINRAQHAAEENPGAGSRSSLIPPIEFLPSTPQLADSSPPGGVVTVSESVHKPMTEKTNETSELLYPASPVSHQAGTSKSADASAGAVLGADSLAFPLPVSHSTLHTPTSISRGASPSFAAADVMMQDLPQPPSSAMPTFDLSLSRRQARLQAISNNIANLASQLPLSSSLSPSRSPSLTEIRGALTPQGPSQPQQGPGSVTLRLPYLSRNQSPSGMNGDSNDPQTEINSNDLALALTASSSALTREFHTQTRNILEAVRNLNLACSVAHGTQLDTENALALQIRAFEDRRAMFELQKQTQQAALQAEFRQLHEKRGQLSMKEASLVAWEKDNRAKEEARMAKHAELQAKEEERGADNEKRRQEEQEQIARALEELRALRAGGQFWERIESAVPDDLPTEPQEGMSEEEVKAIKHRKDLMGAVEDIRREHNQKVEMLEESTRSLRRFQAARKKSEVEERLTAEAERARQAAEQEQRYREAVKAQLQRRKAELPNQQRHAQPLAEQVHLETQAQALDAQVDQEEYEKNRAGVTTQGHQAIIDNATRLRAAREGNPLPPPEVNNALEADDITTAAAASFPLLNVASMGTQMPVRVLQQVPPSKKVVPISGGVMLSASNSQTSLPPKAPARQSPSSSSSSELAQENTKMTGNFSKAPSFVSASTDAGRHVQIDTPLFPILLASELNTAAVANANAHLPSTPPTGQKPTFTPNPKSQTLLDVGNGGSRELNIGPPTGVSPAQRSVNLRHLMKSRSRVEENGSGDRSVRSSVKSEETPHFLWKKEERDDHPLPREPERTPTSSRQHHTAVHQTEVTTVPISFPSRPAVLVPPRPQIQMKLAFKPTPSSPSQATEGHELPFTGVAAEGVGDQQSQTQQAPASFPRASPNPWVMDAAAEHQEWAPVLTPPPPSQDPNSLILGLSDTGSHSTEPHCTLGEKGIAGRYDGHETRGDFSSLSQAQARSASPEPLSGTLSHETVGEDHPRHKRKLSDENRKKPKRNNTRRPPPVIVDYYSPPSVSRPVPSPSQSYRPSGDFSCPLTTSDVPQVESMRAPSPVAGRKRPSDIHDNEHDHRSRRLRGDSRTSHDRDREAWYRDKERRPRHPDLDERRNISQALPDHPRQHPPDNRRVISERPSAPPPPEKSTVSWEYRRSENEEIRYQQYQPIAGARGQTGDQYRLTDGRPAQPYDRSMPERGEGQHDPSLLARMSDKQYFPPSTHTRGRGRGDSGRGRGESVRGRADSRGRVVPGLLERLTSGRSSLKDRLGQM
ncbi:hypothetical protein PAXRUDRAFT_829739 [Paxillus rubicundulus Ve08.2h10]|uniref:Uncharacterized protein n=1 Tax=Paxillus rubicundulus Ve08.2h10 TaxID=930991 RepID=A0A0D0DZN9_9AGAM|nr:hypothetical protein PAXRUDRAFT_829739 [Paxillus rubicundulus Ve08.2h10]